MQLYIVRHGIAVDREDPNCPADPDRFLTQEGIEKAPQVAKGAAEIGPAPDLLLSSPYLRASQTAEIFADELAYSKNKIRKTDQLLPGAEPLQLFRELSKDKELSAVFLFGHAPHLDDLIATSLASTHHLTSLKKSAPALIALKPLAPPTRHLTCLAPPNLLPKAGPSRRSH